MTITRDNWHERMTEDLALADCAESTQEAYLLATRQLVDWLGTEPEQWQEDDLRRYLLLVVDKVDRSHVVASQ